MRLGRGCLLPQTGSHQVAARPRLKRLPPRQANRTFAADVNYESPQALYGSWLRSTELARLSGYDFPSPVGSKSQFHCLGEKMTQIATLEPTQLAIHRSKLAGAVPTFKERGNIVQHLEKFEAALTKSRRPC
jgi:hypothetical protein